jgi:hypothetical protein
MPETAAVEALLVSDSAEDFQDQFEKKSSEEIKLLSHNLDSLSLASEKYGSDIVPYPQKTGFNVDQVSIS